MADTKLAKVGITVKESWKDDISYEVLDYTLWRVQDGGDGCGYIAKRANIGVVPNSDDSVWIKATQAGQSIYDLAVKYGHFEGTEEEFEAEYQAVLQAARDAASETSATNTEIQEAEELRRASEDERADAETARQEAEIGRDAFESDRQIAENMRQMAENQRGENETTRQSQETARESAEQTRQTNESTRQSNETARESAEQERTADFEALKTDMETAIGEADAATAAAVALNNQVAGDESARQQAEQSRVAAETQRQTAETQRGTNESTRQTQETARQTAEQTRQTQEGTRQTQETARQTAEGNRASAESQRASNETARQTAETARETQSTSDHQRAESDHAIAAEDHATLDEKISHKADIDGSYDGMAVGIARNLEGRTDVTDSFFERTTGGDAEVANGTAQLNEVKGKSQVWNQLVQNGNFADGTTGWTAAVGTISANNGILTVQASTRIDDAGVRQVAGVAPITGHKYLLSITIEHTLVSNVTLNFAGVINAFMSIEANKRVVLRKIVDMNRTPGTAFMIYPFANTTETSPQTAYIEDVQMFDLTLIFGAGNEPATVEEFEAWLAENIGERAYYPYNPGEVLNNRMTGVESIGFNLLDPATGKADIIGAYSDVYGNYYGITGTHGTITFTDKFGNTETITPDEDGKFLLETAGTLSVADAGEDCAVFLWWDGTQTEYKQYEKNVGALDVTHIYGKLNGEGEYVRVWPTGMPGIGDIKDSLKVVDGQVVAERKVGEVDMGTLNWQDVTQWSQLFFRALISGIKSPASGYLGNVLNARYPVNLGGGDDKTCRVGQGSSFWIRDAAYNDAASLKTSLNGVPLYYELATPAVYTDLVYRDSESFADNTPVTLPVNYKVDNWGIERIAPQNTEEAVVTAKPELTMRYSIDAVEELNTHRDEIDDLYEKNEELDQRKPEKYGEYPDMAVGSAKNIAGDLATNAEFKFRKTGGNDAVASGLAKLTAVYGKSLVWNQLVEDGDFASGGTSYWNILRASANIANGIITITKTVGDNTAYIYKSANPIDTKGTGAVVANHKYYATAMLLSLSPVLRIGVGGSAIFAVGTGAWQKLSGIIVPTSVSGMAFGVGDYSTDGTLYETKIKDVFCIDLTLMFGAGNEPATAEEFEAMFPLPYYDYNAGEIISNKAEEVKVVGFNQYGGGIEPGQINGNGEPVGTQATYVRTDEFTEVSPSTVYFFKFNGYPPRSNFQLYAVWYDASKIMISGGRVRLGNASNQAYAQGLSPNGARYAKAFLYSGDAFTQAERDAMRFFLSFSDSARNGEYEPYKEYTLQLNIPTLTGKLNGEGESVVIAPDGLKSAGSVYDEAVVENGYITKIIKRIGQVVFDGTETWTKTTAGYTKDGVVYANPIFAINIDGKGLNDLNVRCDKYVTYSTFGKENPETGISGRNHASKSLDVYDPAYSDGTAAQFAPSMAGVTVYFALETPVTYVLDAPIYAGYQEDANGTEKRLPDDTAESVMPAFPCKIAYPIDVVKTINELGNEYVSTKKVQTFTQEEVAQAIANIGLGGMFKWGVISQTRTWIGSGSAPRTYTVSNKKWGFIPIYIIDRYTKGCISGRCNFNETTGYFEYGTELTDITYEELIPTLERKIESAGCVSRYLSTTMRFILCNLGGADAWNGGTQFTLGNFANSSRLEIVSLVQMGESQELARRVRISSMGATFSNCYYLRKIMPILDLSLDNPYMANDFNNCYSLEYVHIITKTKSINLGQSSLIPLENVVYLVQNSAPTQAITVTLHATAYARCVADTTEYTYNSQTYTGIIALAAAKNITIQSA